MKKTRNNYWTVFSICFIFAWLSAIFYFDRNNFDIEFREKAITTATIVDFTSDEIVQEYYDGRRASSRIANYIDYTYFVNGAKYKHFSEQSQDNYILGEKVKIEYVKSNPQSSRFKKQKEHKFNFFVRHLFMVTIFSFLAMLAVFYFSDILNKRDTGWTH